MNSPRCVAANRAGRRFCAECGSPLALACSSCGFSGPDLPERPRRRRWPHRARSVLIGVMLLGFGLSGRSAGSSQDEPSYRHPLDPLTTAEIATARSEERRVGKECRL